jgi:hypothetical protein
LRQQEVLRLRYDLGATIAQMAKWLTISQRAVSYRLQSARRRLRGRRWAGAASTESRGRLYSASQIFVAAKNGSLSINDL